MVKNAIKCAAVLSALVAPGVALAAENTTTIGFKTEHCLVKIDDARATCLKQAVVVVNREAMAMTVSAMLEKDGKQLIVAVSANIRNEDYKFLADPVRYVTKQFRSAQVFSVAAFGPNGEDPTTSKSDGMCLAIADDSISCTGLIGQSVLSVSFNGMRVASVTK